ncbi:MAG: Colicin V production protein [Nitrosospira sp.]
MTILDYSVIAVLAVSVLLSLMRGVVRELLSLAGWIAAFMAANSFASGFAPMIPSSIGGESIRVFLAFAVLFFSTLLGAGLLTMLISALVRTAGLGFADRFFGLLFGLARGLLVVLLAILAAGFTTLPQEPAWKNAMLSKPLEMAALMVMPWLPPDLSSHISYAKSKQKN